MSDKKQIAIIFLAAFAIAFGSLVYMAGEIDKMAQADKHGSVDIRTFCSEGLEPTPSFCVNTLKTAENAPKQQLKVVNNYDEQVTAHSKYLQGGW